MVVKCDRPAAIRRQQAQSAHNFMRITGARGVAHPQHASTLKHAVKTAIHAHQLCVESYYFYSVLVFPTRIIVQ